MYILGLVRFSPTFPVPSPTLSPAFPPTFPPPVSHPWIQRLGENHAGKKSRNKKLWTSTVYS